MPLEGYEPLPSNRKLRLVLIEKDSVEFCRRMGELEIQRLLRALTHTVGLTPQEVSEETDDYYARWREDRRARKKGGRSGEDPGKEPDQH